MIATKPIDFFEVIRDELKKVGAKVTYIGKNPMAGHGPRLQIALPFGRTIHMFIFKGLLILSKKAEIYAAEHYIDLNSPNGDPQVVVDLFREMFNAQIKFVDKFEKLSKAEAEKLAKAAYK